MTVRSSVKGYYASHWGPPARTARFTSFGHEVEVYKWLETATGEGVTLYATNGASAECMPKDSDHRVEFHVGFTPAFDDIAPSLSLLATYPLRGGVLAEGDTVTLGDPLWRGAKVRTFLIVPPLEELLPSLTLDDSSHVSFLQVLPISDTELELKKKNGAKWLLGELNDLGFQTWNATREYL